MDLSAHPCFDDAARLRYSRVHLPVAAGCNVQCNFCDRRFDCANESRPGVTSVLLTVNQAAAYVDEVVARDPAMRVVGIAGPGDPLAAPKATLGTLEAVRKRHPELLLCVATNGLALPAHAAALGDLGVSHVTVTVNAVDPEIAGRIYDWVLDGKRILRGREAGALLLERQRIGIEALVGRGVLVKINSILIPGVNDAHIAEVARVVAELGAARFNCMPLRPVVGTPFGDIAEPSRDNLARVRQEASRHLLQMEHCSRCRADAVGRIGHDPSPEQLVVLRRHANRTDRRQRVAVASQEGILVNQHLGEATEFHVYERRGDGFVLTACRPAPGLGGGTHRWQQLGRLLDDCRAILVSSAGPRPKEVLSSSGLEVIETDGLIEDALDAFYQGRALAKPRNEKFKCGKGVECGGTGLMCG
jgi:nitrogen fixation protein NifB